MAGAAECQVSYLSRVLRTKIQVTPDQAFRIAQFLRFDADESDYFMWLVEWDRAVDSTFRKNLEARLQRLRDRRLSIQEAVKRPAPGAQMQMAASEITYHSHWGYLVVHVLINMGFQTSAELVRRTQLPEAFVQTILEFLLQHGLIEWVDLKKRYEYRSSATHISKDSPILHVFHNQWRQRALVDAAIPNSDGLHFTNVQSISREDFAKVRSQVLALIKEVSQTATRSGSEELFSFTCDLFRV